MPTPGQWKLNTHISGVDLRTWGGPVDEESFHATKEDAEGAADDFRLGWLGMNLTVTATITPPDGINSYQY